MTTQNDVMRLVAEVTDKASPAFKKIQSALKEMGAESKKSHSEAAKHAREHAQRIKELHERIEKFTDVVSDGVTPALATMGITGFGVGEAFATLGEKIKSAAESYDQFNATVKRGSVSASYVDILAHALERVGISGDKAHTAISSIGETLDKLHRGEPKEMQRLQSVFGNTLPWLEQIERGATTREEGITRLLKALTNENIPIDQRDRLAQAFGIDPELATKDGKEFAKALRESIEEEAKHPINMPLLEKLNQKFIDLKIHSDDFWRDLVNTWGPASIKAIDGVEGALDKLGTTLKTDYEDAKDIYQILKAIWDFAPAEWMKKSPGEALNDLGKRLGQNSVTHPVVPFLADPHAKESIEKGTKEGTKQGLIDGLREWWFGSKEAQDLAAGIRPMSYRPGDIGGLDDGVYYSDGRATGGGSFTSQQRAVLSGQTPKTIQRSAEKFNAAVANANQSSGAATNDDNVGAGLSGSDYLKARRERFAKELQDPNVRARVKAMMQTEGTPLQSLESAMNRADYTHKSLSQILSPSFYGPMRNHGRFAGIVAQMRNSKKYDALIAKVLAGSDTIHGYTDQGLPSDPNGSRRNPLTARDHISVRDRTGLNEFTDWEGGPHGRRGAKAFREMIEQHVLAEAQHGHGAHLSDMIRGHGSLLKKAHTSGLLGGGTNNAKLTGEAELHVNFHGMPRGTTAHAKIKQGFKQVALNRGRPMAMASQDS